MPVQPVGIHICPVSVSILQFLFCESCKIPNLRIVADTQIPCLQKNCQILRYYVHIVGVADTQIPCQHTVQDGQILCLRTILELLADCVLGFFVCAPYQIPGLHTVSDSSAHHILRFHIFAPCQIPCLCTLLVSMSAHPVRFHVCAVCTLSYSMSMHPVRFDVCAPCQIPCLRSAHQLVPK